MGDNPIEKKAVDIPGEVGITGVWELAGSDRGELMREAISRCGTE